MDRLLDNGVLRDLDDCAIGEEGGVQCGESVGFEVGVTRQMTFDATKSRLQTAEQRGVSARAGQVTVDEDETSRLFADVVGGWGVYT